MRRSVRRPRCRSRRSEDLRGHHGRVRRVQGPGSLHGRAGVPVLGRKPLPDAPGAGAEPVLVAWGMTTDGRPVLLSVEPGATESTDAWRGFPAGMVERGLRAPVLVISDGGAGLIAGVELVFPSSARQRCLIHRARNLLARVPKHAQAQVKTEFWADLGRRRRRGGGDTAGQGVQRHVVHALPDRGRDPQRRLRAPGHLPALPQGALASDPPLQLHRADFRRDPPEGQGDRPAPRRRLLPVARVGRVGPGQCRLAKCRDDPQGRPATPTTPTRTARVSSQRCRSTCCRHDRPDRVTAAA